MVCSRLFLDSTVRRERFSEDGRTINSLVKEILKSFTSSDMYLIGVLFNSFVLNSTYSTITSYYAVNRPQRTVPVERSSPGKVSTNIYTVNTT